MSRIGTESGDGLVVDHIKLSDDRTNAGTLGKER